MQDFIFFEESWNVHKIEHLLYKQTSVIREKTDDYKDTK
jgi:hypothetical protein